MDSPIVSLVAVAFGKEFKYCHVPEESDPSIIVLVGAEEIEIPEKGIITVSIYAKYESEKSSSMLRIANVEFDLSKKFLDHVASYDNQSYIRFINYYSGFRIVKTIVEKIYVKPSHTESVTFNSILTYARLQGTYNAVLDQKAHAMESVDRHAAKLEGKRKRLKEIEDKQSTLLEKLNETAAIVQTSLLQ